MHACHRLRCVVYNVHLTNFADNSLELWWVACLAEWALLIGLSPAMGRELAEHNIPKCTYIMQKHYRNTGHTGLERRREIAQGCDGHQQNDCYEDCQYPPTTIPWVKTKQHQIQSLLTLVQSLVTLHCGDSKHCHTCYIQWINVQAMSAQTHFWSTAQHASPINRLVWAPTGSERVKLIILQFVSISWVLITGLKDLANLNQITRKSRQRECYTLAQWLHKYQ